MAGMFYSLEEAKEKLNASEEQVRNLVEQGKLREFRDGTNLLFKVSEVEALVGDTSLIASEPPAPEAELIPEEEEVAPSVEPLPLEEEPEPVEGVQVPPGEVEVLPEEEQVEAPEQAPSFEEQLAPIEEAEAPPGEAEALPEEEQVEAPEQAPSLEEELAPIEEAEAPPGEAEVLPEPEQIEEPEEAEAPSLEEELAPVAEEEEPKAEPEPKQEPTEEEVLLSDESGGGSTIGRDLTNADTAITQEGISVLGETDKFELSEDTMAETTAMGEGGPPSLEEIEEDASLDTFGSGSGLLDLSLQADDTSLGGILDEIYTPEGEEGAPAPEASAAEVAAEAEQLLPEERLAAPAPVAAAPGYVEPAPDASSIYFTLVLIVSLIIVAYTAIVSLSGSHGLMPAVLEKTRGIILYALGGLGAVALVLAVMGFMAALPATKEKKPKVKKEKKPKVKKEKKPKPPKKEKPKKEKKKKTKK